MDGLCVDLPFYCYTEGHPLFDINYRGQRKYEKMVKFIIQIRAGLMDLSTLTNRITSLLLTLSLPVDV